MKKMFLTAWMIVAAATVPALAQDGGMQQPGNFGAQNPPFGSNKDNLSGGTDAPQPLTGELVPLPGAPPANPNADLKLPNCTPGNCGVPQIMQ